jgi:hypothetical protein
MNPIGLRTWTDERDLALKALRAQGISYNKISDWLGVSRNAAIGRGHRLGLSSPRKPRDPDMPRNRSPNRPKAELRVSIQRIAMLKAESVSADTAPIGTKSLLDLAPDECRFPFGDKPYTFCGCKVVVGLPYCAPCAGIAYGRVVIERARTKMSRFGNWATGTME